MKSQHELNRAIEAFMRDKKVIGKNGLMQTQAPA